ITTFCRLCSCSLPVTLSDKAIFLRYRLLFILTNLKITDSSMNVIFYSRRSGWLHLLHRQITKTPDQSLLIRTEYWFGMPTEVLPFPLSTLNITQHRNNTLTPLYTTTPVWWLSWTTSFRLRIRCEPLMVRPIFTMYSARPTVIGYSQWNITTRLIFQLIHLAPFREVLQPV